MLAAFEKEHRSQPLKVIGIECQGSSEAEIKTLAKDKGAEFTIVSNGEYPRKQISGIPRAFVFDHTGKEIYDGNPAGAEAAAATAVLAVPAIWFPADATFTKLKAQADQALSRKNLGQLLTSLRSLSQSTDDAEKTEAASIVQVLEGYASRRKDSLKASHDEDPEQYLATLDALAKEFAGDAVAAEAKAQKDKDLADPAFTKLRAGFKALAAQTKALAALAPCKACKAKSRKTGSVDCPECLKINADTVASVKKALVALQKKYEDTAVATKAAEMAGSL